MSILRDFQNTVVEDFQGPWPLLEAGDIPITNAQQAQNVEYIPGLVKTRFGYQIADAAYAELAGGIGAGNLYNWFPLINSVPINALVVPTASTGPAKIDYSITNLATNDVGQASFLTNAAPLGVSLVSAGPRLYATAFDVNGQGTITPGPQVFINYDAAHNVVTTSLFTAINDISPVATNSGTGGVVTPGSHNILLLVTSSAGFTGVPQPFAGTGNPPGSFYPVEALAWTPAFISANGNQITLTLSHNGGVPNWTATGFTRTVQVLMTRSDNLNRYYIVPGVVSAALPITGSATVTLTIDISDDDLAATGEDGTPFFDVVVNDQSPSALGSVNNYLPPINPAVMTEYNGRIAYVGTDFTGIPAVYVSDPAAYQSITLDQHVIYTPGQRQVTTAFVLSRTLYIVGPHWTYFTQDTGDVPVNWPTPSLVDGSIGTLSPLGVTVNASTGFAWVADTSGLYLFSGGAYVPRPLSYYQTPIWNRINWAAAASVQVVDNAELKRVQVLVPLDTATTPNYILTWDYTRGLDPEDANFSMDFIAATSVASIGIIQHPVTRRLETWILPAPSTSSILRQANSLDTNPYRDIAAAIQSLYQTALLPGLNAEVLQHHGDHLRLQGAGTTHIVASTLDGGRQLTLDAVLESGAPAQLLLRRYHALSEAMSLTLSTQDLDTWFQLSELTHYYTGYLAQR